LTASHSLKKLLRRLGRAIPDAESATDVTSVFEHIGSVTKVLTTTLRSKRTPRGTDPEAVNKLDPQHEHEHEHEHGSEQ
jgi:hypothetical protein